MKKARIIVVIAALIVSLSGCANTNRPQTIQDSSGIETVTRGIDERTEPEDRSSASVSESKESAANSTVAIQAETESAQAENSQPAAEQSPAPVTQPPQTVVPNNTPKAVEPTPEPKPTPTQQPTPPPAEETPKVEQPQETTPAPEEPAVPEFNIQTWIDYAKTYAVSVGLRLESSAVDCWDNKLYISELIAAAFALTAFLPYLIFKNISFLVFSAICFSYCAFAETAILFIEKKARKHINRRLKILNKSLERTVRRFPQDELFLEKRKFEREYKFLEKK